MTKTDDFDDKELKDYLDKNLGKMIKKELIEFLTPRTRKDEKGRLLLKDNEGKESLVILPDTEIGKAINERLTMKQAAQMSLQKKEKRFVINLPEWMKDELQKRAKSADKSMNEIIRTAIADYLSREKA